MMCLSKRWHFILLFLSLAHSQSVAASDANGQYLWEDQRLADKPDSGLQDPTISNSIDDGADDFRHMDEKMVEMFDRLHSVYGDEAVDLSSVDGEGEVAHEASPNSLHVDEAGPGSNEIEVDALDATRDADDDEATVVGSNHGDGTVIEGNSDQDGVVDHTSDAFVGHNHTKVMWQRQEVGATTDVNETCDDIFYDCRCSTPSEPVNVKEEEQAMGEAEQRETLCLSEDCIVAASTVLSSLDRTVDPCQDFYQFACGGFIDRSVVTNTDRFSAIDKFNQNIIAKALTSSEGDFYDEGSAEAKAKRFYHSCMVDDPNHSKENLLNLQAIVGFSGGWNLTANWNASMDLEDRINFVQNKLGLDVFFTWGVIEHESGNRLAIVAGGWNDALVMEMGKMVDYLKLMTMYTILLSQAIEDEMMVNIDYPESVTDVNATVDDENNSLEVSVEYMADLDTTYLYEDEVTWNDSVSKIMSSLNPFSWMNNISDGKNKASTNDVAREIDMPNSKQKGNDHLIIEDRQLTNDSDAANRGLNGDEDDAMVEDLKKAIRKVFTQPTTAQIAS